MELPTHSHFFSSFPVTTHSAVSPHNNADSESDDNDSHDGDIDVMNL